MRRDQKKVQKVANMPDKGTFDLKRYRLVLTPHTLTQLEHALAECEQRDPQFGQCMGTDLHSPRNACEAHTLVVIIAAKYATRLEALFDNLTLSASAGESVTKEA